MKNLAYTRTMYRFLHNALKVSFSFFIFFRKLKINSIFEIQFNSENRKTRNWEFSISIKSDNKIILLVHGLKNIFHFSNLIIELKDEKRKNPYTESISLFSNLIEIENCQFLIFLFSILNWISKTELIFNFLNKLILSVHCEVNDT